MKDPIECLSVSFNHIVELYEARKWVKPPELGIMPDMAIPPARNLLIRWRVLEHIRRIIVGLMEREYIMAYFVTFGAMPVPIGSEHPDISAALEEACRLIADGQSNVAIQFGDGRSISGDDLIACCSGEKAIGDHLFKSVT